MFSPTPPIATTKRESNQDDSDSERSSEKPDKRRRFQAIAAMQASQGVYPTPPTPSSEKLAFPQDTQQADPDLFATSADLETHQESFDRRASFRTPKINCGLDVLGIIADIALDNTSQPTSYTDIMSRETWDRCRQLAPEKSILPDEKYLQLDQAASGKTAASKRARSKTPSKTTTTPHRVEKPKTKSKLKIKAEHKPTTKPTGLRKPFDITNPKLSEVERFHKSIKEFLNDRTTERDEPDAFEDAIVPIINSTAILGCPIAAPPAKKDEAQKRENLQQSFFGDDMGALHQQEKNVCHLVGWTYGQYLTQKRRFFLGLELWVEFQRRELVSGYTAIFPKPKDINKTVAQSFPNVDVNIVSWLFDNVWKHWGWIPSVAEGNNISADALEMFEEDHRASLLAEYKVWRVEYVARCRANAASEGEEED